MTGVDENIEENLNESFEKFLIATQTLIESNYILIDRNISVLLHSAVDCEIVYNLIAKSMVNFDFVEEWRNATEGNFIKFPEDSEKKLAFIFCMLNNIDDRKLDITKVFDHYFSCNQNVTPYELFCSSVIDEFRNLVLKLLNPESNEEYVQTQEPQDEQSQETEITIQDKINEMLTLIYKLKDEVRNLKRLRRCRVAKGDVIAIISTLEFAVKRNDLEYFYALVLSIKALVRYNKTLKEIILKIEAISNFLIRS